MDGYVSRQDASGCLHCTCGPSAPEPPREQDGTSAQTVARHNLPASGLSRYRPDRREASQAPAPHCLSCAGGWPSAVADRRVQAARVSPSLARSSRDVRSARGWRACRVVTAFGPKLPLVTAGPSSLLLQAGFVVRKHTELPDYADLAKPGGVSVLVLGDAQSVLAAMPSGCAQAVVTSPPYWSLRDYGIDGQLGLEDSVYEFIDALAEVFEQV